MYIYTGTGTIIYSRMKKHITRWHPSFGNLCLLLSSNTVYILFLVV